MKKQMFIVGIVLILLLVTPVLACTPKTCSQLGKSCGIWSDQCTGSINCGTCPAECGKGITPTPFGNSNPSTCKYCSPVMTSCTILPIQNYPNHIHITGCHESKCASGSGGCNVLNSYNGFVAVEPDYVTPIIRINKVDSYYTDVINLFGGENYLNAQNYPFPDININFVCDSGQQQTICNSLCSSATGDMVNINPMDNMGSPHEMIHWVIRSYSHPTSNFYSIFEEGFTNIISKCMTTPTDPCCNKNYGTCILPPDLCKPDGSNCNYQGVQAAMITETASELNCDIFNCWQRFFQNNIINKKGADLDISDAYCYLVSVTGDKNKVSTLLNRYTSKYGIDTNSISCSSSCTPNCVGKCGGVSDGCSGICSASCGTTCNPNWQTSSWSSCSNSLQTRTVSDSNNCNSNINKPTTSQSCGIEQPTFNLGFLTKTAIVINGFTIQWWMIIILGVILLVIIK